ncbi:MAG: 1-acyl-sn-glycerol-3-phosphate acyltransferase [Deltaproteobacteria bacterium]|nr:MAG: 1-acyl-sn-glycerol-3-phosphate acyltransferase [Deltaproteobacteria bacterium]
MSGARGQAGGVVEQRPERERPPVTTRGRGARAVRLAAAVASALVHLIAYRASALVWGASPSRALAFLRHWSVRAWRWLDLEVRAEGIPAPGPCVYVANHRGYLDVPLLAGVLGASFMSRADVAGWWIVGAAAKLVGSVFVERDDPHGRVRAARGLARRLASGSVIVFPEGKTGARRLPGPFHPGLFRLLHRLGVPVVPVTIRYGDRRAYWTDDSRLVSHLWTRVLAGPSLPVAVHVGTALDPRAEADGESLARAAYHAVCRPIEDLDELV